MSIENLNNEVELSEEELFELNYNLVDVVLASLKVHQPDYCFSMGVFKTVLNLAKENKINLVYKIVNDKQGNLDYVEFRPTHFYKFINGEKVYIEGNYQFPENNLPIGWKHTAKKPKDNARVCTIPENMIKKKGKRKTIDYLAKAQGKEYLF